jgi:anti-anti-sigma regulatory factor
MVDVDGRIPLNILIPYSWLQNALLLHSLACYRNPSIHEALLTKASDKGIIQLVLDLSSVTDALY